ncbi:MAG: bifunctional diguanylate cyclase/phosphodiesterase [Lachnospiraceae bacterium]|nr:bifunctional diguanylate cyclase/phosphodiesterase [Lachnospiraceae bacterium]
MPNKRDGLLVTYNVSTGRFVYPENMGNVFWGNYDSRPLWQIFEQDEVASDVSIAALKEKLVEAMNSQLPQAKYVEHMLRTSQGEWRWTHIGFIAQGKGKDVLMTLADIDVEVKNGNGYLRVSEFDDFSGLYNRNGFTKQVDRILETDRSGISTGEYALCCFDVLRFKAINDLFGPSEGDRLLIYIANVLKNNLNSDDIACHPGSDRFIYFTRSKGAELVNLISKIHSDISAFDIPFEIACNTGVYVTTGNGLSVDSMLDRAVLAQSAIKGSYTIKHNFYTEELRNTMLGEQEIVGIMNNALEEEHFVVYYQPQYNHSTGMLLGAEALVRWNHPDRGLISPGLFIPIFEKNGFITKLDMYVFEQVCKFLKKCMDKGLATVPISTNFSRHDLFMADFVEKLEEIRTKYEVPVKLLRVEITESAVMASSSLINDVVKALHDKGYVVEMDDFGSGYSSLNVLKDIELDVIKLDMLFLSEQTTSNRGGTILSSVVRMAKWLDMPVIAEGVETVKQADFLRSIGCDYIQGYLYSRPIPADEFEEILSGSSVGAVVPQMRLIDTLNACDFWNPASQETLIFSNYVGGAAIFDYHDDTMEVLRVNQKYLRELGMNLSEKEIIESDPTGWLDDNEVDKFKEMLHKAIDTMEEQECETWGTVRSACCGEERLCVRHTVRLIGKSDNNYLFYTTIRNITAEKSLFDKYQDDEKRFKVATEHANVYFWEYNIITKDMRPCFRCMRDLGLPALVRNYPQPLFDMGIVPEDYEQMYRDWMKEIDQGKDDREEVVPLTVGRIPFKFKYTVERDENGRPIKAYGSATIINGVVDDL